MSVPGCPSLSEVRKKMLSQRRALSEAEALRLSDQVCEHFNRVVDLAGLRSHFWRGKHIGMYRTQHSVIPGELSLRVLEGTLREKGAELFFPRVDRVTQTLEFAAASHEDHWTTGAYGLQEPVHHHSPVSPDTLEVIFVPGLAFGRSGERIGMGAGYYDRYLLQASKAHRVALAFDFQLHSELEQNSWDQPVHWIVTQSESIILKDLS